MKTKGSALRLTGLILGIAGTAISIIAIVFSLVGTALGKNAR